MSDPNDWFHEPEVKEGYASTFYPVRWKAYKPGYTGPRKGRWQRMNEYGGWDNLPNGEAPETVHAAPFDADEARTTIDAQAKVIEELLDELDAVPVDFGYYESAAKMMKYIIQKARDEFYGSRAALQESSHD
ncbi:hypothetical protein [uncultured Maritimibacter sp.]|uniref:hypothetical protein n=1 Tax=uncultured Maritimibacter sp. TaxID=991866 RepID=UPI0025917149|nr:hypothetical protein [uncultured Maritimibacter sp.]